MDILIKIIKFATNFVGQLGIKQFTITNWMTVIAISLILIFPVIYIRDYTSTLYTKLLAKHNILFVVDKVREVDIRNKKNTGLDYNICFTSLNTVLIQTSKLYRDEKLLIIHIVKRRPFTND